MPAREPAPVTAARITRKGTIIAAIIALIGVMIMAYLQYGVKRGGQVEYLGRVIDANTLQPIADAKITLALEGVPPIVYSDSEGVYRFKLGKGPDLRGQIRVDAQGYQIYTRNIELSRDTRTLEDIRLVPQ